MKKIVLSACLLIVMFAVAACFGGTSKSGSNGGEVTGVSGSSINEPTPYGMVLVNKGSLKMGSENTDSLWGKELPTRDISVDAFWMDEHEVTNSMYRQFVYWVRDSIIRERLAAGGDESFKIDEDKNGEPITPHLNWSKAIPWKNPDDEQKEAIESM